jgi:acyl-homoserine lactone synthase
VIHLICAENRHLYEPVLGEMHHARNEYFVQGRGWTNLTVQDGQELDEYDGDRAIYLIGFEADGTIGVSCRLLRADSGCILADSFSHLVSEGPVRGQGVFELSRYFSSRKRRGPAGFGMRSALHVATLEATIARGATRLIGFTDVHIMALFRYTGWRVRPIGIPAAYDEGTAAAFEIGCRQEDLASTREQLQLFGRQLFEAPSWLPAGSDVHALAEATDLILNAPEATRQTALTAIRQAAANWTPQGDAAPLIARLGDREAA